MIWLYACVGIMAFNYPDGFPPPAMCIYIDSYETLKDCADAAMRLELKNENSGLDITTKCIDKSLTNYYMKPEHGE